MTHPGFQLAPTGTWASEAMWRPGRIGTDYDGPRWPWLTGPTHERPPMSGQLYEIRIEASGEVRDAEGNLISHQPIEATATLTEEQVKQLIEGNQP